MRSGLVYSVFALSLTFCQSIDEQKSDDSKDRYYETIDLKTAKSEYDKLYQELLEFRNKPDFVEFGLGKHGPYNAWLMQALDLSIAIDSLETEIPISELIMLGVSYAQSDGEPTETSEYLMRKIDQSQNLENQR